jgi:hypothetical protein
MSQVHLSGLAVSLVQHILFVHAERSWYTGLSKLFQLVRSGIRKIDVSISRASERFRSSEKPKVLQVAPGVMIIFGDPIKKGKTGIRKRESSSYVRRLVDDG